MLGGIRIGVWLVSGAASLCVAGSLLRAFAPAPSAPARSAEPVAVPVEAVTEVVAASHARSEPALASTGAESVRLPVPTQRADVPAAAHAATPDLAARSASGDSRLAADLRILEDEAARVAEALALLDPAALEARIERAPAGATRDELRRIALADAFLVEHFVQDAYRGTEFPIGFPAEERTRAAARSQVTGLTSELRRDVLEVAIRAQREGAEPTAPRFAPPESGLRWDVTGR